MGNCSNWLRSVSTYGPRRRSAFVRDAVLAAVERQRRAIRLRAAAGILVRQPTRLGRRPGRLGESSAERRSTALAVDAVLATGNPRHFPSSGIEVEHWPVGE